MNTLKTKLENHQAVAAVIGLGYVGLPLAMEIAAAGFKVIGIDLDRNKINTLKQGKSYILDVAENIVAEAVHSGKFTPTADFSGLANADTVSHRSAFRPKPRAPCSCTPGRATCASWRI